MKALLSCVNRFPAVPALRLPQPRRCCVSLSARELALFSDLRAAADSPPAVTVRVAGGWVRDKLLGRSTHDVDVAVQGETGEAYCARVSAYLRAHDTEAAPTGLAVVRSNPAQSKHLSTAIMVLRGYEINVTHLRSEAYAQGSRIPTQAPHAAPETDALRRDFTVNALFYNLHTGKVEDFTRMGLADLAARRVRTPLAPACTLSEDPLRALRAIRFAVYLADEGKECVPNIEPELLAALASPNIHSALRAKVSRERIALELLRLWMLPAPAIAAAYKLYAELGILSVVVRKDVQGELTAVMAQRLAKELEGNTSEEMVKLKAPYFLACLLYPVLPVGQLSKGGLRKPKTEKDWEDWAVFTMKVCSSLLFSHLTSSSSPLRTLVLAIACLPSPSPSSLSLLPPSPRCTGCRALALSGAA